jgi:hypothetical protein
MHPFFLVFNLPMDDTHPKIEAIRVRASMRVCVVEYHIRQQQLILHVLSPRQRRLETADRSSRTLGIRSPLTIVHRVLFVPR